MADVWLAPYLPLVSESSLGPWTLVPFRDFRRRHARSQPIFNEVRRLCTAYKLNTLMPLGAVVVASNGRVGDEHPRELLRLVHRSLVVTLIDGNPSFLDNSPAPNVGHHMTTAENAAVFGHPIHGGRSYALTTGAMVQRMALSHAPPGRRLPPISPPPELPTPLFARFDDEYAGALYGVLEGGNLTSRRLDRSIEWLALAWNNAAAISEDARVIVFRAGLEALLGGGASTRKNRDLLSRLLDPPNALRTPRTWLRQPDPVPLTDLEWWFQSFALLRNKVAHGDLVEEGDRVHDDGKRHLWHADDVLRRALKRVVAEAIDEPDLERPYVDRIFARALRKTSA